MEPPYLSIAFGAHVPRREVCKLSEVSERKYRCGRYDLNVFAGFDERRLGRNGDWKFMTVFSILKAR